MQHRARKKAAPTPSFILFIRPHLNLHIDMLPPPFVLAVVEHCKLPCSRRALQTCLHSSSRPEPFLPLSECLPIYPFQIPISNRSSNEVRRQYSCQKDNQEYVYISPKQKQNLPRLVFSRLNTSLSSRFEDEKKKLENPWRAFAI